MHHRLILFVYIIISFGSVVCGFTLEPFKNGYRLSRYQIYKLTEKVKLATNGGFVEFNDGDVTDLIATLITLEFHKKSDREKCKIYIWMTHLLNDAFRPFQLATIIDHFEGATEIAYNLFETKKYFEEQFNNLKCNNVSSNLNLNESILIYRTLWPNSDMDKETLKIVDDLLAMCSNFQQPGLYKHLRAFFDSNQINEAILMLEKRHSKSKLAKNVMEIKKQIVRIRGRNEIDLKNVTIFYEMMKKLSVKLRKHYELKVI